MALVLNNRVRETTTTTGTGAQTLGGAVDGFQTFSAGIGNSNTTYYAISLNTANEWEVGLGTLNGDSTTLTRTTVLESSNSDSAVDFSAGAKEIFCTLPAEKAMYLDASGAGVGGLAAVVDDTTPQLGGDLDVNGNAIVSASDGAIAINANGTGTVTMTTNSVVGDVIPGKLAGTNFTGSLLVGHSTTGTLSSASQNTAVGDIVLRFITDGHSNTGMGRAAMANLTGSDNNVAIGVSAGQSITTGSGQNTLLGVQTGYYNKTGGYNTAVGGAAMFGVYNQSHEYNVGVGYKSLYAITTGDKNVAIGMDAQVAVTSGEYNISLGQTAGNNITTGSGNVVIGVADVSSATGDDQLSISDGEDGAVVWMTGESTGNVEINEKWNPSLSTTGKAFVMGF